MALETQSRYGWVMSLRTKALSRELCGGTFINLGSSVSVEMAGHSGFDWLLIDLEHGIGGYETLLHQLQAASGTSTPCVVRVQENRWGQIKKVLDYGAAGVMVPFVEDSDAAAAVVAHCKYHPQGMRGAARFTRACGFGRLAEAYVATANETVLTVVQIETPKAVANAEAIAAVPGVDVLFVGPYDLTLTTFGEAPNADLGPLQEALKTVAEACRRQGKACGILLSHAKELESMLEIGITFIALGSDGSCLAQGLQRNAEALRKPTP